MLLCSVVWISTAGLMVFGADLLHAQNYPSKPIRVVTAEAGGGADFTARLIAQGLSGSLGQQTIIDNRQAIVAIETVAKAPPDGYTLLLTASLWITPFFQSDTSWDPIRDFSPVIWVASAPSILVVHPSLPVNSVRELIALAKSKPGELNYATSATGTANHLAAESFKSMAGVNIVRINYRGGGPALNDLLGGQVQLMFSAAAAVAPHFKSGRLRALAVTSAQRSALAPDLPTVEASGLPGYESITMLGVFAPVGVSTAIIHRVNQEIARVLSNKEVKERFLNAGVETVGGSADELGAKIRLEMTRLAKVVKDAGIGSK